MVCIGRIAWMLYFKTDPYFCLYSLTILKGRSGKSFQPVSPPTLMTLSRCWRRRQISSLLAPCFIHTQSKMKRLESSRTRFTRYHIWLFNGLPFCPSVLRCAGLDNLQCLDYPLITSDSSLLLLKVALHLEWNVSVSLLSQQSLISTCFNWFSLFLVAARLSGKVI